jgi:general secretion pathway protein H
VSRPARQGKSSRGFTLLELLVVLAIIGLLLAIMPAALSAAMPELRLRTEARDLAITLRSARSRAISEGRKVDVTFDQEVPGYAVAGEPARHLRDDLSLNVFKAHPPASRSAGMIDTEGRIQMRFYPDGSATGGTIELAAERSTYLVEVDWLLGGVTVIRKDEDV